MTANAPVTSKTHAVDIQEKGDSLVITIGNTAPLTVKAADINPAYLLREFARGLKLRIDNAAAGSADEKKLSDKVAMLKKIDFSHPSGGISGGRKKETSEGFLARYTDDAGKSTITSIESYQDAVVDAQANVRKDELSDVLVELSTVLADVIG